MSLLKQIVLGGALAAASLLPAAAHAQCTGACSINTLGSDTVIAFTGNGTFTPPAGVSSVEYLVVGGGGGGGGITNAANVGGAGGGGGGGVRAGSGFAVTPGNVYNIIVGAGGAGANCGGACTAGGNGGDSTFSTITADGGGRGGYVGNNNGATGGSGGGGRLTGNGGAGSGGQGNAGGDGSGGTVATAAAGGGGGAGAAGAHGAGNDGGDGGAGVSSSITGAAVTYGGGGGGGGFDDTGGSGGAGGGGSAPNARGGGTNGTNGRGGGGGGAGGSAGGGAAFDGANGGSGIVIIRYGPPVPVTYYTRNNGNWSQGNRWSTAGCGGSNANTVPPAGANVVICTGDTLTLNEDSEVLASLTVQAGGILNIGNNNTARALTVAGDVTNAGMLRYNNNNGDHTIAIGGQFTNGGTFTSVNNTNGGARTLTVTGLIDNSGTFRFAGRANAGEIMTVNANGGFLNSGTLDVDTGSNNTHVLNVGADFTNNGTVNLAPDGNSVADTTFNGSAVQVITGSSAASVFNSVTLGNANGLSMTGTHDVTVTATLTLTNGRITTNANVLYIASGNAVAGASVANFVVGNLRKRFTTGNQTRLFEVGTVDAGTPRYAPASIEFGSVTAAGDYTVTATSGDHPDIAAAGLDATNSVNRYWTFTNNGLAFAASANDELIFGFADAELDAGATLADLDVGRFSASAWTVTPPPAPANGPVGGGFSIVTMSGAQTLHTATSADYQIAERGVLLSLVSATAVCGVNDTIEVLFSAPVTAASAQNPLNYALSGGATVGSAVLDPGGQIVTLTTSALASGQGYTLTVNNVVGAAGGTLPVNSQATFFTEGGYLSGLKGTYYDQNGVQRQYFTGNTVVRQDGPLDFDWGAGIPVAGIGADDFSVRWEGFVTPSASGSFTFRTRSDDGVRLYLDTDGNGQFDGGNLIIDNWTDHGPTNNDSPAVALTAGQRYMVRMEFYERGGGAVAQLLWSGPGTGGFQLIPRANLSHACGLPTPVAFYKLDELAWNGSAGEAADSSGNNLHGAAGGGALPFPAQVCNGAQLDGTSQYVQVPHDNRLSVTSELTVTAWINPDALGAELKTIVSKDENFEFHLTSAGQINWWWQDSAVNTRQLTTSGAAITPGAWYHIAIVYASGSQAIYINGVSRAADTFTGTLLANTDPLQIGADQYPLQPQRAFDGRIDEVRIYNRALSQADIAQIIGDTRPCVNLVTHYEISFPNGATGVTCDPSDVLITAHDATHSAVAPAAGTLLSVSTAPASGAWLGPAVAGSGIWTPSGASNGLATYQWPGAETSVRVRLRQNTPATININLLDSNGRAESEEASLAFADTGFRVTADGVTDATVGTQIAGKPSNVAPGAQTLYLQVIKTDTKTGTCVGAIQSQTADVQLAAARITPAGGASQVSVRNSAAAMVPIATGAGGPPGTYTSVSLAFDAQSKAPLVLSYGDAGRISVHAQYELPGPPAGVLAVGDTGQFVVRPFGLAFRGVTAAAPVQHGAGAASSVLAAAGDDFTMTLAAYAWSPVDDADNDGVPDDGANLADNALTPNFAAAATVSVHPTFGNTAGVAGAISRGGAAATISAGAWSNGAATANNWQYSEVGNVYLRVSAANYLGSGADVTGNSGHDGLGGGYIGRFRAHHLFVSGAGVLTNRVDSACASTFTYMGEPIGLTFTLQARNASGALTQNYAGAYAKLDPATIAQLGLGAMNAAGAGLDLTSRVVGLSSSGSFVGGAANVSARLSIERAAPPPDAQAGPYADVRIGVAPQEPAGADGAAMRAADLNLNVDSAGGNDHVQVGGSTGLRFGRLRLDNAVGSEKLDLPIAMRAEYWTGSTFATNADDSCTSIAAGNVAFGNYQGGINAGNMGAGNLSGLGGVFSAGAGNFVLLKPAGALAAPGSVDICIDLGADATCTAITSAARSYLQTRNSGASYDDDPRARAAFGLYGSQPNNFIYFRENF